MRTARPLAAICLGVSFLPGVAFAASDAGACNPPLVWPAPGAIPANLPGFVVEPGGSFASTLSLVRVDGGDETEVEASVRDTGSREVVLLEPAAPLVEGARYEVRIGPCVIDPTVTWPGFAYEVVGPQPAPTELGTLRLSELRQRDATYYVEAELEPDPGIVPWLAFHRLSFSAQAGGATANVGSVLGARPPFRTRVRVACGELARPESGIVAPGALTVRARAEELFTGMFLEAAASTTTVCDEATPAPAPSPRGCAVGGGADGSVLVLAALAWLVTRARRRHAG
ncbi:hypothetical protein [Sandaracinus amylolyticus]|uniref:hypothetical protein n=1 Tax=Sandaracinus amylolyticus TaxID=927083 RepID=UPI001F199777|nr:hypothetical protein [Sandaracinus amylolyticus]UJR85627.1 Hypothetical protein I5071_77070 [Sandaracinus amylolyticus]